MLLAEVRAGREFAPLGDGQLPEQLAGGFVQAPDQSAPGEFEPRVASQRSHVGADEYAPVGNCWIAVGETAEPGDPFDIPGLLAALAMIIAPATVVPPDRPAVFAQPKSRRLIFTA